MQESLTNKVTTETLTGYRVGGPSRFYDIRGFNKQPEVYFRDYSDIEKEFFDAAGMTPSDVNEYEIVNDEISDVLTSSEIIRFWQRGLNGRKLKEGINEFPSFAKESSIEYMLKGVNAERFEDEFSKYPDILKTTEKMDLIYLGKFWGKYVLTDEGKEINERYFKSKGIDPTIKILDPEYIRQMKQHLADRGIITIDWMGVPSEPKTPHKGMIKVTLRDGDIEWRRPL